MNNNTQSCCNNTAIDPALNSLHGAIHVLIRDERKKQAASKVKQTNKAKQHSTPKAVTFAEKNVYNNIVDTL